MSQLTDITPRLVGGVVVLFIAGFIILVTSFRRSRLGVAGVRGESMLVDLRDRIQSQGTIPTLPGGWHAEAALPLRRRHAVRGRLRRHGRPAGPGAARGRRRRRLGQGRGRRHPRPAAVRGVRRTARRAAAGRLPPRRQRLPAAPAVGRGVRHRGPPLARPQLRRLRGAQRRPPAGRPPDRRARAAGRSGRARARRSACSTASTFPAVRGAAAAGRRDHALHRRPGGDPAPRTSGSASTGCWARPSSCCAASSTAGRERLIDALGSRSDDRALVLVSRGADRARRAGASVGVGAPRRVAPCQPHNSLRRDGRADVAQW